MPGKEDYDHTCAKCRWRRGGSSTEALDWHTCMHACERSTMSGVWQKAKFERTLASIWSHTELIHKTVCFLQFSFLEFSGKSRSKGNNPAAKIHCGERASWLQTRPAPSVQGHQGSKTCFSAQLSIVNSESFHSPFPVIYWTVFETRLTVFLNYKLQESTRKGALTRMCKYMKARLT